MCIALLWSRSNRSTARKHVSAPRASTSSGLSLIVLMDTGRHCATLTPAKPANVIQAYSFITCESSRAAGSLAMRSDNLPLVGTQYRFPSSARQSPNLFCTPASDTAPLAACSGTEGTRLSMPPVTPYARAAGLSFSRSAGTTTTAPGKSSPAAARMPKSSLSRPLLRVAASRSRREPSGIRPAKKGGNSPRSRYTAGSKGFCRTC